jgi:hypothetical protein
MPKSGTKDRKKDRHTPGYKAPRFHHITVRFNDAEFVAFTRRADIDGKTRAVIMRELANRYAKHGLT